MSLKRRQPSGKFCKFSEIFLEYNQVEKYPSPAIGKCPRMITRSKHSSTPLICAACLRIKDFTALLPPGVIVDLQRPDECLLSRGKGQRLF
jgi:hypothetical protein